MITNTWRLNNDIKFYNINNLEKGKHFYIPSLNRDIHYDTNELLDRCHELQIPVHIDSAWITASKDIEFDYDPLQ